MVDRSAVFPRLAPILADLGLADPLALVELKNDGNVVFRVDLADGSSVVLKTFDDRIVLRPWAMSANHPGVAVISPWPPPSVCR